MPVDCEVFGIFRDLIPAALTAEGGELQFGRKRAGLCPDFRLRLPSAAGPLDSLGELKFISAGVSRYPIGSNEKQVDRRARELPGSYRRPLHYVHFVKYDDAVSFYDAVSDTIRRRGGNRGIFTEEGVDTVAYFGGNHGSRV